MVQHNEAKVLLSDRQVAERYDVVVRTLERWDRQPDLGFPPPVRINGRRYRSVLALEQWDRANARKATPRTPRRVAVRKPATAESREAS